MATLNQRMAQAAFPLINSSQPNFKEYKTFAKKFPALIHTCGLAQAVAFAQAKQENKYLDHLAKVVHVAHADINNATQLGEKSRAESLSGYLRLSRNALLAAGWLKRYAEALSPDSPD